MLREPREERTYNPDSKGRRVVVRQSGKRRCLRPNSKAETGLKTLTALLALAVSYRGDVDGSSTGRRLTVSGYGTSIYAFGWTEKIDNFFFAILCMGPKTKEP